LWIYIKSLSSLYKVDRLFHKELILQIIGLIGKVAGKVKKDHNVKVAMAFNVQKQENCQMQVELI